MAGPWDKYQPATATGGAAGPWDKFKGAAPAGDQWERATLLPMETNKATGERRLAWPQIAVDAGNAMMAPGDALNGKMNDVYADPETGAVDPFNPQMMQRAAQMGGMMAMGGTANPANSAREAIAAALTGRANRMITKGLKDGGVPLSEVDQRLAGLGDLSVIADLTPQLQKQAQALATMPGPGQKTVVDALMARQAGRNSRIISGVDDALGPAVVPSRILAANKANMEALGPEYLDAFRGSRAVDTKPIADHLDALEVNLRGEAQKAAAKVRDMLDITGNMGTLDPNPYTLFQTRQAIDGMMATEANPKAIGVLSEARKMIDDELQKSVPGIKQVDAKYAELARQNEAVGTGQTLLDSGRTATRPQELQTMMQEGAIPQGEGMGPSAVPFRLTQGNRAEIDRLIGTTTNDFTALKTALKGDGSWNRDRLVTLYGQEKADKLLNILEREGTFIATEAPALNGSRTQILKAAQDEMNGVEAKPGILQSAMDLKPGTAARVSLEKGTGWAIKARRDAVNAEIAKALMSRSADQGGIAANGFIAPKWGYQATARDLVVSPESRKRIVDAIMNRASP